MTALADTKWCLPLCIPQTEGGGPEINREGDGGGDLARWNHFIASVTLFINLPSHWFWTHVQAALRWFMLFYCHHWLNYSWCRLLKSNPPSVSLLYCIINSDMEDYIRGCKHCARVQPASDCEDIHYEPEEGSLASCKCLKNWLNTEKDWPCGTGGWDSWTETCLCPTRLENCKTDTWNGHRERGGS